MYKVTKQVTVSPQATSRVLLENNMVAMVQNKKEQSIFFDEGDLIDKSIIKELYSISCNGSKIVVPVK